jgi:proline iminopeptidase
MKKVLVIIGIVLIVSVAAVVLFFYFMGRPLYEPGMVRRGEGLRSSTVPPARSGDASFWDVENDIKLYHFAEGTGRNVLIVHGGPGYPTRNPWAGLKSLTGNYRFNYYDQRGCGKSTRPADRFSSPNFYENMRTLDKALGLGAQIADIERIRQILGEDKLVLVGHSFGGFLASLYAAEFPQRVEALVLVAPANLLVMPAEDGDLFEQIGKLLPEGMKHDYADFQRRYFDFGHIFAKSEADLVALNGEFPKYYAAALRAKNLPVPAASAVNENGGWMVFAMYMSMGRRHDYRPALQGVKAPVLVVHGDSDLQPEKASRLYAESFPNSSFRVVQRAGHFVYDEQPQAFSEVVGKFLSEAGKKAGGASDVAY